VEEEVYANEIADRMARRSNEKFEELKARWRWSAGKARGRSDKRLDEWSLLTSFLGLTRAPPFLPSLLLSLLPSLPSFFGLTAAHQPVEDPRTIPNLVVFSGSSHPMLAEEVCDYLDIPVGKSVVKRYASLPPSLPPFFPSLFSSHNTHTAVSDLFLPSLLFSCLPPPSS